MRTVGVTVTQIDPKIRSLAEYTETIQGIIRTAKDKGTDLVLLPLYTGCLWQQLMHHVANFPELLLHPGDINDFLEFHCRLAKDRNVYLACGSVLEKDGGDIFHTGYLISNKGQIVLKQRQTHLSRTERTWKLSRGTEIKLISTDIGRIGVVVGNDRYYPEVSRIMALKGADLVLAPGGDFCIYNFYRQVAGMWREVQQNQFYALESYFNGPVLDREVDGRACILAPCELTEGNTGVVCGLAEGCYSITSKINLADLTVPREKFPVFKHFNVPLYGKYFV